MKTIQFAAILLLANVSIVVAQNKDLPMTEGKFKPTDESLKQYKCPEWFRDAKFGIWSVWGPMAVPRQGDWYSKALYEHDSFHCEKNEYRPANARYKYHLEHYGHPSEFGFKDLIPLWKAEKWNPEEQMKLFKRAGAKYFVTIATHHDNFFLWNSKLHKWNAANMGPKKDVVGLWQKAAKNEGLFFGVTEHLGASYNWFQVAHGADQLGAKAGVPYDGANPAYWDLYHEPSKPGDGGWLTNDPKRQRDWYDRIRELVDDYQPDLLYSDSALPFGDVGRTLIAHYYNQNAKQKGAKGVVYTCKEVSNSRWVRDYELGVAEGISEHPWQTDSNLGDWIYREGMKYRTGKQVIQMLVDIVSKNGNLLLDVVQTPEGDIDDAQIRILEEIADWMLDNGDAIFGTRPWKVYGEGPSTTGEQEKGQFHGVKDVRTYRQGDLRFTAKGKTIYAFCMEKPEADIHISSLGLQTATGRKVKSITLAGSKEKIKWTQNNREVVIQKPAQLPEYSTVVFEIR
ncbi:MAG: alpha-L-fucosidase [Bacteroidales bacterium]|nr:alpha-L-fucosidase [Bacteroidales bacterium]